MHASHSRRIQRSCGSLGTHSTCMQCCASSHFTQVLQACGQRTSCTTPSLVGMPCACCVVAYSTTSKYCTQPPLKLVLPGAFAAAGGGQACSSGLADVASGKHAQLNRTRLQTTADKSVHHCEYTILSSVWQDSPSSLGCMQVRLCYRQQGMQVNCCS